MEVELGADSSKLNKKDHLPISCSKLRQNEWILMNWAYWVLEGSRGQGFKDPSEMQIKGFKESRVQGFV